MDSAHARAHCCHSTGARGQSTLVSLTHVQALGAEFPVHGLPPSVHTIFLGLASRSNMPYPPGSVVA